MPIKINLDGVSMDGNAQLLNGMKISGEKSNVDIKVKDTTLDGNSKTLNNMDSQNAKVHIDINGIKRSGNSEFMNNKTYNGNQQEEEKAEKQETKENETEVDFQFVGSDIQPRKDNLITKTIKLILKRVVDYVNKNNSEQDADVEQNDDIEKRKQKNNHYSFEAEMSRNGELKGKNIDLSKVNVEKGQNETNLDRGSR